MTGLRKYLAKLLVLYVFLTNTFLPSAYASQLYNGDPTQQAIDDEQASQPQAENIEPVAALPVSSHKFMASASVLGLSTNDALAISAHKRLGVTVQKMLKHDFKADEDINVTLNNPDQETYKTKIIDVTGKEAKVQIQKNVQDGTTQLQIIPTNQFKPGKYTISVTDQEGKTTQQDFTWGVLALNPDKAIYKPKETADFSMAVLDDRGKMVCNAQVSLEIREQGTGNSEVLSTDNGKIKVNPECNSHGFTLKPDYEAQYKLGGVGKYALTLTAKTPNGTHTITDEINVQESIPFDIQRTSATRIYPPNAYPMQINVTANQDFKGTITETVPDSFAITQSDTHTSYNTMKTVYLEDGKDPGFALSKQVLGSGADSLVMPFDGNYPISQGFGTSLTDVELQAFYAHYGLAGHDGVDFALPMGTPLYAVDGGKVVWSGPGDYGTQVIIQHSWGKSYYGHMSKTSVENGADVKKGSLIGYSGMSGEATGPHLHFGMKPNHADMSNGYAGKIDPLAYLPIGNGAKGISSLQLAGLPSVLGASDSAEASSSGADVTPTAAPSPQPSPSMGEGQVIDSEGQSPQAQTRRDEGEKAATSSGSLVPSPDSRNFTIDDTISQQSAEDQPQSLEKIKVIKWQVDMKKGDKMTLSYNFKTPQISPQFYLVGPLKFYADKSSSWGGGTTTPGSLTTKTDSGLSQNDEGQPTLVYDEGRQWQIAADDLGTGWYHPSTNPNSGYEWQYRKKLTIDHTKVGVATGAINFGSANLTHGGSWGTSISVNYNVTSTNNSYLLVGIATQDSGTIRHPSTVKYKGVNMTPISGATRDCTSTCHAEMWYIPLAATGNGTVTASYTSGSSGDPYAIGAVQINNVDATTPFGTVTTNRSTTNNTTSNVSITGTVGQMLVSFATFQNSGGTGSHGSLQQNIWFDDIDQNIAGSYIAATGSTQTLTESFSANQAWAAMAVPINPVVSQADQSSFPVLVSLTSDSDLSAHAQANGNDILFTDSGGENKIPSEVESYSSGTLVAWVNISNLSSTTDTSIYMYYGNGSVGSQSDPTDVWDSNFQMVQHLDETSGTTVTDSTSNGHNGTKLSSSLPAATTGEIGGAQSFNGSTARISFGDVVDPSNITVSAWVKPGSVAINQRILSKWSSATSGDQYLLTTSDNASNKFTFAVNSLSAGALDICDSTTTYNTSNWYYLTGVYDGTTCHIYVNGTDVTTSPLRQDFASGPILNTSTQLRLGVEGSDGTSLPYNGRIDEVRLSSNTRSAGWVSTEYANQSAPSTFFKPMGAEETKIFATTNDMLMRHGKFFDNDVTNHYGKQPFLF